jgi:tRNA(fMet)-specific endonuclease VapC
VFFVLDTDHFTALVAGAGQADRISQKAAGLDADFVSTIITAQEVLQGWLAVINRQPAGDAQLLGYGRFYSALKGLEKLALLPFDAAAAVRFNNLQRLRLRIGTMDLKIAAICLTHDVTLLTRNIRDFDGIPGLLLENWVD